MSDRMLTLAQRHSGTVVELIGRTIANPSLVTKGRSLRARAGLREVLSSAKLVLRTYSR